jgi:hypothetical protein
MVESDMLTAQLHAIYRVALAVSVAEVEAYVSEIDRTETLMPLVDPTAYMRIGRNIPGHRDVARAFLDFRRELAKHEPTEAA